MYSHAETAMSEFDKSALSSFSGPPKQIGDLPSLGLEMGLVAYVLLLRTWGEGGGERGE